VSFASILIRRHSLLKYTYLSRLSSASQLCLAEYLWQRLHKMWFTAIAGLLLGAAAVVADSLPTISAVGNKFFDKNGKQFFLKGTVQEPEDSFWRSSQADASIAGIAYQLVPGLPHH
jgi:hypothetical protein